MGLFLRDCMWITNSKVSFIAEENGPIAGEGSSSNPLNTKDNEMNSGQRNSHKRLYIREKGRFWDRIPETDGPWVWSYQEILIVSLFCVPLAFSSIKASKNKQKSQSESESLENSHRLVGNELLPVPGSARHFEQTSHCCNKTVSKGSTNSVVRPVSRKRSQQWDKQQHGDSPERKRRPELPDGPFSTALFFPLLGLLWLLDTGFHATFHETVGVHEHVFTRSLKESGDIFSVPRFCHFQVPKAWHSQSMDIIQNIPLALWWFDKLWLNQGGHWRPVAVWRPTVWMSDSVVDDLIWGCSVPRGSGGKQATWKLLTSCTRFWLAGPSERLTGTPVSRSLLLVNHR